MHSSALEDSSPVFGPSGGRDASRDGNEVINSADRIRGIYLLRKKQGFQHALKIWLPARRGCKLASSPIYSHFGTCMLQGPVHRWAER